MHLLIIINNNNNNNNLELITVGANIYVNTVQYNYTKAP